MTSQPLRVGIVGLQPGRSRTFGHCVKIVGQCMGASYGRMGRDYFGKRRLRAGKWRRRNKATTLFPAKRLYSAGNDSNSHAQS
jgi:hypothetical protein